MNNVMCERCTLRYATTRLMSALTWTALVTHPEKQRVCDGCAHESVDLLIGARYVFSCSPLGAT